MKQIPVARPNIGDDEIAAVDRVMRSGMLAQGPEVDAFEREFSELVCCTESVAVNSGTSALHAALLGLGVGRGDEVIVPSFTFAATANAVALTGATPIFADIDPHTFCMDPEHVAELVTPRTRAIVPVHLFGHPADIDAIRSAAHRDVLILEDAAQAHVATYKGRVVGSLGDAAAFSFYPTKNMTSGEGGMITTSDPEVARICRLLRNQGMERRYENEIVGFNYRMTDIHAAIGRAQLTRLCEWTVARQRNAAYLSEHLRGVTVPLVAADCTHVFHQYTIRVTGGRRDLVQERLTRMGVGTGVFYPTPVHRLPSFARGETLPETESAAAEVLSLPVHPSLSPADLERIVDSVNEAVAEGE